MEMSYVFVRSLSRLFRPIASILLSNICHLFAENLSAKFSILKSKLDYLICEIFFIRELKPALNQIQSARTEAVTLNVYFICKHPFYLIYA